VQLREFCKKVASVDSRINTAIIIKGTDLQGAYAVPGQWVPDQEILKRLLMQVQLVVGIASSNAEIYGDLGYVMITHKAADFFFYPLEDRRVFLVSVNRPYDHNALEPRLAEMYEELRALQHV
jgi:hypothetical protein